MRIHLNKKGIRALGVAESFRQPQRSSLLAGVVMRGDFVVDGVAFGKTSVGGDDATSAVASLHRRLRRNDVNLVMVSGAILSLYNIIDVDALARKTRLPVICLTYKETGGIEQSIIGHFPERKEQKLEAYRRLGKRQRLRLSSGFTVYARTSGLTEKEALTIVDMFTVQGSLPEPVRVAKLLARAGAAL